MNESVVRLFQQWMREQQLEPDRQTHDNDPLEIVNVFPARGNHVTEDFLKQRVWWWRKANENDYAKIFRQSNNPVWSEILYSIYNDRFSLSAYRYELLARCQTPPAYPLGVPWIRCSNEQRRFLECLWPHPWPAQHWLPHDEGKVEWVKLDSNFNLNVNDATLVRLFKREIAELRNRKHIPTPATGQGVRRKDHAWWAIEQMDLAFFHGDNLNGSQRSSVSKAKKNCEEFCDEAGIAL